MEVVTYNKKIEEVKALEAEKIEVDKKSQRAAVRFFRRHLSEIEKLDPTGATGIGGILDLVDSNLDVSGERHTTVVNALGNTYCELNGVDPESKRAKIIFELIDAMLYLKGERDPREGWNNDMSDQSKLEFFDRLSSLVSVGGFWEVKIDPDVKTVSGGALEVQRAVFQAIIEIAEVQKKYATKTLPKMANPPDASIRMRYEIDAAEFDKKSRMGTLPWQGEYGNDPYGGLATPKSEGRFVFSPLFKFMEGKCIYKDYESLEKMPIRVFRETEEGLGVEYTDISATELLSMSSEELQKLSISSELVAGEVPRNWITPGEIPDLNENGPLIGISLGGFPNPDSPLFLHSRSGQTMMHIHYNNLNDQMLVGFGHASIDGDPGMDWALSIAEAVGATKHKERGLEIEWNPPTLTAYLKDINLSIIQKKIRRSKSREKYVDDDDLFKMVNSLKLSDINIGNELNPEVHEKVMNLVNSMNEKWWKPLDAELRAMIKRDQESGKDPELDDKAVGYILYQLANSKMTDKKFFSLMTRQFYGPSTACKVPRDKESRLELLMFKAFDEDQQLDIRTYSERKRKNTNVKVFETKPKNLVDEVKSSYKLIKEVFGQTWLFTSVLTAIKQSNAPIRRLSEVIAFIGNKELYKASLAEAQNSDNGLGERRDFKGDVLARVSAFVSAQAPAKEESRFAVAKATIEAWVGKKLSVIYNDRVRLTAPRLDKFRMSVPEVMKPSILRVAMVLGRGVKIDEEKMTLNANRVLSMMTEARRVERHVSTPEHLLSNCLLVANVLEQIRNMDNGEDVLDCFEGMQLLTIAGMLDEQESFYDTCGAVSVEALQALQAR